uniref:Cyclic nucleotide-binding domain-containing protein n=1 Tax=Heliothis virescens TaxID=7102 RepID=A0A2A4JMM9_HELVI
MDADTTKRIIRYYEDLWYQKSGVFKPKLLKLLPYPLQMEICYDLNAVPLYSSLIFRKLPEAFLRRLSLDMSHQFYLPGDVVYNHNQNKTIMVCVTSGVLELLSDEDDESPMISFAKGTCFGEISLVYNIPARCTVKAATYVECQVLEKTKFIKLMMTYPDLVDSIRAEIQERINRSRQSKIKHGKNTEFSLNIYASKDRKKSSIKCLKDKLRFIQGVTDVDTLTEEDHLDESCLDLYILSEHIKKKATMFTCIKSSFPWILEADCPLVKYWELYMLCIVFYICLFYPYFIGFKRKFPGGIYFYTQIIVTISLIVNIFMTSVTAVKAKKQYINDFKNIVIYRMNTLGFYLDVVAIIPFEYIVTIHQTVKYHDNYRDHLFFLCKGIKLCLVWRLSSFFEKLERKLLLNSLLVKIVKYCVYICLLCYWSGVILFMESCFVNRCSENSWFSRALTWDDQNIGTRASKTKYPVITSVYFATTLLLSVGYGDYTPGDIYDMAIVAFLSLYGVLLTGFCVSEFSAVVTHWSRTKTAFLEVIITIDRFMKENNMHPAIKSRIMAFYELQWQYNSGVELTDDNWLEKTVVPSELRKKVLHQARFKALTSIKFFQVKNKAYIHTLTEAARDIILPPGEIVFYGGTITRELYIIESGYCLVTSNEMRENKCERVIGPGNHVGLLVLLYGIPTLSTVVTLTHCKLVSVNHYAYTSALSLFPDMKEHEGLLKPEELKVIEEKAKTQTTDSYLQHYNRLADKKQRVKITSLLQEFFNNSFIDLSAEYNKTKENYRKSFKQFHVLNNVSSYLLMPIAIRPDGIFLKTWAILRVATAFLLCLLIPVIVCMAPQFGAFNVTLVILETICYIDMYLMLHVAYYGSKNQLIYHPYMTAKHYLQGQFVVDFLTCFPWYALWKLFVPKHEEDHTDEEHEQNHHMFHCTLRMINVLQVVKLYTASWAESIGALKRAYFMSVVHFLLLTLFFWNLYTSLLIALSCRYVVADDAEDFELKVSILSKRLPYMKTKFHPDGNMVCLEGSWVDGIVIIDGNHMAPAKIFLLAYYWTATSFGGAGFGDITPQNMVHMVLCICVNIHGALFFGYVYARIASLKAMADQVVTKFQENLKHLEMFLTREKVPFALKKTVIEYWKYQWKRTGGWSHQSILGKLHANLNEDAVLYMYEKTLREIPLFEDVEYSFFRAFAKKLKELYFQKGYMVMRSNEVIDTMYIIYRGKVDIISNINEVEACMGPGGIFGNIRGASKYLTMSNVVASRNIDLLCIQGRDFYTLLKSYPSVLRKVKQSVESAPKDYVLPTVVSERTSEEQITNFPESYKSGEEEEEEIDIDPNVFLESPDKSLAESHGSKSITSAGNVDYTPAAFLLLKPHRWFRSSIIPDSKLVTFMEYLILFLSYVDFMLLVYQMAFLSIPYFFYVCVIFDILFLFKVFLDVHSGYMNRYGDYVLNPRKVRKMYFSKVYLRRRDFLANLVICYGAFALPLSPSMKMAMFCYARSPQLTRISYLFTYRTHRKTSIGSANLLFKLTTIAIWASILSHVNACLFFKLSCLTPVHCTSANWMSKEALNLRAKYSEGNFFALYVAALWYMINLLTITGTGDVSSQNSFEVIETIIVIIVIKFCTGLLISEMSAMITAHSSSRIAYDYNINELRDGLRDMDLSVHQMGKMWDYVRELWNRQQGKQMPSLVYKLPFRLRCQVMQAVYGSHIRESVIFSKTDDDFRRMLAMWMKHCVFFPGNYIVQSGDSDQCIYFIHRGQVEVLTVHPNLTESIYDVLGPEDSFGVAQGLFVGLVHHFSFRARTVVDIVYLKLDQWKYLLDYYPKSAKIVQKKVANVYLAI